MCGTCEMCGTGGMRGNRDGGCARVGRATVTRGMGVGWVSGVLTVIGVGSRGGMAHGMACDGPQRSSVARAPHCSVAVGCTRVRSTADYTVKRGRVCSPFRFPSTVSRASSDAYEPYIGS